MSDTPWIDLQRQFFPVTRAHRSDVDLAYRYLRTLQGEGWANLLSRRCSVILGEAGSGKTRELQEAARRVRAKGDDAFFIRIEELGADVPFAAEDDERFEHWRKSDRPAWFFLDSVDENKLRGNTLLAALRRFARSLSEARNRANVIVSSRVSDWRDEDADAVLELDRQLRSKEPRADRPDTKPHIVDLLPLDERRIVDFAKHLGAIAPDDLFRAIEKANAWDFASRPLDVQWLVAHWNENRQLGPLHEIMQRAVFKRLSERPNRARSQNELSSERARAGARLLALATVITARPFIRLSGIAADEHAADSLDPQAILSDWKAPEIDELLSRGLFDEATYGRARIHHRSVSEYLAAEELAARADGRMSERELRALFFKSENARRMVPRHLTSTLAWLAPSIGAAFLRDVVRLAPEVLLDEGDPSRLPIEHRIDVLRAYADRFRERDARHGFDSAGLRRFTSRELLPRIRELLGNKAEPDHVRRLLLKLAEEGGMRELLDLAVIHALDRSASSRLRQAAIRTAGLLATDAERRQLRPLLCDDVIVERDVAWAVLDALYPSSMTTAELLCTLDRVGPPAPNYVTAFDSFLRRELLSRCGTSDRRPDRDRTSRVG